MVKEQERRVDVIVLGWIKPLSPLKLPTLLSAQTLSSIHPGTNLNGVFGVNVARVSS